MALSADRATLERAVPQATRHERLAASSKEFYVGQLVGIDTNVAGSPVTPAVPEISLCRSVAGVSSA
jgi:hypothetical protein